MVKIAYLAHDLADPAIGRRLQMLKRGGAEVRLAGFARRADRSGAEPDGTVELGQTKSGRLADRVMSVAAASARLARLRPAVTGADVILARNLEMLVLASAAKKRFAPRARLVYECLDIHRLLCSDGMIGMALRSLENRLWRGTDTILTSSPAFVRAYFGPRGYQGSIRLVENKVLDNINLPRAVASGKDLPGPWRIGYFGMIRCRKSLEILASVAAAMNGQLEIAVRGLPSPTVFPDFAEEISRMPHVTYYGPYAGLPALADAYNKVHFAWAIDYYEAEQNSAWLLPNRLYESLYFGAIPLAQRDVEIGRWLTERRAGVLFDGEMRAAVHTFFSELTPELYASLCDSADAVPVADIAFSGADCKNFVENLVSQ